MKTKPIVQAFGELTSTPIGAVGIFTSNQGIMQVKLLDPEEMRHQIAPDVDNLTAYLIMKAALEELDGYLSGKTKAALTSPIDWGAVSEFDRKVLTLTRAIPYGSVCTYGDIASQLGSSNLARAVGMALSRNPFLLFVPCHRVVGKDGRMHGFSALGGVGTKIKLLTMEGLLFKGEQVILAG